MHRCAAVSFSAKQLRCCHPVCCTVSPPMCRMDGATMNIVGTKVQPVIFAKVEVQPEHNLAKIMVEKVVLEGSEAVRSAGGSFNGEDIRRCFFLWLCIKGSFSRQVHVYLQVNICPAYKYKMEVFIFAANENPPCLHLYRQLRRARWCLAPRLGVQERSNAWSYALQRTSRSSCWYPTKVLFLLACCDGQGIL